MNRLQSAAHEEGLCVHSPVLLLTIGIHLLSIAPAVWAHPHVWIESRVLPVLDEAGLEELEVTWLFDDFNSADIRARFDANRDDYLNDTEQRLIFETAFQRLEEIGYFLVVHVHDERRDIPRASRFEAFIEEEQIGYRFRVPLNLSWAQLDGMTMAVFDESYYVSFFTSPAQEQVSRGNRVVQMEQVPMRFTTDGWGGVSAPAVEMRVGN